MLWDHNLAYLIFPMEFYFYLTLLQNVKNSATFSSTTPYADHILIPQGSTGSSTFFWYPTKGLIFLFANPKFQLQILCSFGDITKNVKLIYIPKNNLCIFIIASSPGVQTAFKCRIYVVHRLNSCNAGVEKGWCKHKVHNGIGLQCGQTQWTI